MIFSGQSREELRGVWLAAWQKSARRELLTPLESQLAALIQRHPEYHAWLANGAQALGSEAATDNPFLHLSLHLALQEQASTDRPPGIRATLAELARRLGDAHAAEHRIMELLGRTIWEAQRSGQPPDERRYGDALRSL